jgi:hypothetical protein
MPVSLGVRTLWIIIVIGAGALLRAMPRDFFDRFRENVVSALAEDSELHQTFTAQAAEDEFDTAAEFWRTQFDAMQGDKTPR